nr:MAG TPA: hypothetical protein [Caudoviricetes sp.]
MKMLVSEVRYKPCRMKLLVVSKHTWLVSHEIVAFTVPFLQPLSHQFPHFVSHQFTGFQS